MSSQKPEIRVRMLDGQTRSWQQVHAALGGQTFVRVYVEKDGIEFKITVDSNRQLENVRAKLGGAGFEEIVGGRATDPDATTFPKPFGFVSLPKALEPPQAPVWHDGSSSADRLSGEVRFEFETLTPLLVGWERRKTNDNDVLWSVPHRRIHPDQCKPFAERAARLVYPNARGDDEDARQRMQRRVEAERRAYVERVRKDVVEIGLNGADWAIGSKPVLCPLRAPWGKRPVVIPGDSLKGLLRHELGALLGAPMERAAERSYSYRPNLKFPLDRNERRLEPRLARVLEIAIIEVGGEAWPVPARLDVLAMAMRDDQGYYPRRRGGREFVRPPQGAEPYKGGMGAGSPLPDDVLSADARRRQIHTHIDVHKLRVEHAGERPRREVVEQYGRTLAHLLDTENGHFSARHPQVGNASEKQRLGSDAIHDAAKRAFQPGDLIWVEWDTRKNCIVSFGWHYYYRWAYVDSVRHRGPERLERYGLFPLPEEREMDAEGAPKGLSAVRRLFGYTGDNDGSKDIGKGHYSQLMGRISVNAALEVIADGDSEEKRFLPPTYLRELGMPRPSAVEHYLKQPHYPNARRSDSSPLVTYGDAEGYDTPGELAGRKFYLDREDAYGNKPRWEDSSEANRLNDRSTLALEASRPGRRFRYTLRFRDLEPAELAAIVVALCPHQFREVLGGRHADGYCSKLGYARPLGWGSVRIEAKALLFIDEVNDDVSLKQVTDVLAWVKKNHDRELAVMQDEWLAIHRHKHPYAADYPTKADRDGNENIYTFHTSLRAEHSRARRYDHKRNR